MTLFNYLIDNGYVFYSLFACTAGFMGYKFVSFYLNSYYVDKGVQTDAWEDYSDRPSQILCDSITSIDTVTPKFSPVTEGVSTVTTILPIPPVDINIIPNPDLIITKVDQGVQTISNPMYGKDWNTIIEYLNNRPSFSLMHQGVILE